MLAPGTSADCGYREAGYLDNRKQQCDVSSFSTDQDELMLSVISCYMSSWRTDTHISQF